MIGKKRKKERRFGDGPLSPLEKSCGREDKLSEGGFGSVYKGIRYKDGLNVLFVIIIIENSY